MDVKQLHKKYIITVWWESFSEEELLCIRKTIMNYLSSLPREEQDEIHPVTFLSPWLIKEYYVRKIAYKMFHGILK